MLASAAVCETCVCSMVSEHAPAFSPLHAVASSAVLPGGCLTLGMLADGRALVRLPSWEASSSGAAWGASPVSLSLLLLENDVGSRSSPRPSPCCRSPSTDGQSTRQRLCCAASSSATPSTSLLICVLLLSSSSLCALRASSSSSGFASISLVLCSSSSPSRFRFCDIVCVCGTARVVWVGCFFFLPSSYFSFLRENQHCSLSLKAVA
jgi:hypothetical protein